jgi:hypothetical protein
MGVETGAVSAAGQAGEISIVNGSDMVIEFIETIEEAIAEPAVMTDDPQLI